MECFLASILNIAIYLVILLFCLLLIKTIIFSFKKVSNIWFFAVYSVVITLSFNYNPSRRRMANTLNGGEAPDLISL